MTGEAAAVPADGRPTVSVVMGVFNGAKYVETALTSVLRQEGVDFELVVVDDGSVDGTPDILRRAASRDTRVRVITQPNTGLTSALVAGCEAARGRLIARQDADDISLPGRLAAQAGRLDAEPELSLVSCWGYLVGPEGEVLLEERRATAAADATAELLEARRGPAGHGSAMFRAADYRAAGGYRREFRYAQDWDLWFRLMQRGRFACVPERLYALRVWGGSITAARRRQQERLFELARLCHDERGRGGAEAGALLEAERVSAEAMAGRGPSTEEISYFIGKCLLDRGDRRSRRYLLRRARKAPWDVRAWAATLWSLVRAHGDGETLRVPDLGVPEAGVSG